MENKNNTNSPAPEPVPEKNVPSASYFKKKFFFLSSIVSGIIFGSVIFFLFLNTPPEEDFTTEEASLGVAPIKSKSASAKKDKDEKTLSKSAPKVYFEEYETLATLSAVQASVSAYSLKSGFVKKDIVSFAELLELKEYKEGKDKDEEVLLFNEKDIEQRGVMSFNKKSGSFFYESYGVLRPKNYITGQTPANVASLFVKELGLDETVSCANTYQKKGMHKDITFVECHRDFSKIKIPVVNLGGILNIIGDKNVPGDASITNVKNVTEASGLANQEGLSRPNDFNTITFVVAKDGRILSIDSKLRFIDKETVISKNDFLTPSEALNNFEKHKYQYALTVPSGTGVFDYNKVYPGNKAYGKKAIINGISLVYLDRPFDLEQEEYIPYYLIQGLSELESGYTVKFAQVVPALKSKLSSSGIIEVAGGKIVISQKVNITGVSKALTVSPTPLAQESFPLCLVDKDAKQNKTGDNYNLNISGYAELTVNNAGHSFFYKPSTLRNQTMNDVRKAFYKAASYEYAYNFSRWVVDNKAESKINSKEDILKLFSETSTSAAAYLIPHTDKPYDDCVLGKCNFNVDAIKKIANDAAGIIMEAQQKKEIPELAKKESVFPDLITKTDFEWIFLDFSRNTEKSACYISG